MTAIIRTLAISLVGAGLLGVAAIFYLPREGAEPMAEAPTARPEEPTIAETAVIGPAAEIDATAAPVMAEPEEPPKEMAAVDDPADDAPLPWEIRDVTGDGIAPAPDVTGPLTRLPGLPPPPEPVRKRPERLFLVKVVNAGTIESKGMRVQLAHVKPTPPDHTCTVGGETRPCGRLAATALTRIIRGRAVDCTYRGRDGELRERDKPVTARCAVGPADLSKWLVEFGWAEAANTAPDALKEAEAAARAAGRGIWAGTS